MAFQPAILTTPDEPSVTLVVEAKVLLTNLDRTEAKLKQYIVHMRCPIGVLITPESRGEDLARVRVFVFSVCFSSIAPFVAPVVDSGSLYLRPNRSTAARTAASGSRGNGCLVGKIDSSLLEN